MPTSALRSLLEAQQLLGLSFGIEIAERRSSPEPLQRAYGEAKLNDVLLRAFQEVAAILGEHLDKVHESRRPHYSPELRFRILRVRGLLGLSQPEVARLFRVAPTTIARWEAEVSREPDKTTVGSLVKPALHPSAASPTSFGLSSSPWPSPASVATDASLKPSPAPAGNSLGKAYAAFGKKS